jgi:hypothetical protein
LVVVNKLREEITRVAYWLYEKSGRKKGNDLQNWLAAEKIVYFNHMISGHGNGTAFALLEYKPEDVGDEALILPKTFKLRPAGQGKYRKAESRQAL